MMIINIPALTIFDNVERLPLLSMTLGFLGYVLYRLGFSFSWIQVVAYVLLLVNALVFVFAMVLLIATVSFWTTQSYGMARIFDNLLKIGRYPLDIFEGFLKIVFIYFIPLILIAQIPSLALLHTISPTFILFSFIMTSIFLVFALGFWNVGLKNYLSSSS